MYQLTRTKKVLRCNIECSYCTLKQEFIEGKNGKAILTDVNEQGGDESLQFDIIYKCASCGFETMYTGKLDMKDDK